jgi:hypothetical protein
VGEDAWPGLSPTPPKKGCTSSGAPPGCALGSTCSMLSARRGFRIIRGIQRWTARLLVFMALAGTLLPLAFAGTAAPAHWCCRRAGEHRCHSSAVADSEQPAIRDAGCNRDCCRAATTAQWARPERLQIATRATASVSAECDFYSRVPSSAPHCLRFGRAPPALPIA